jgi:hypothetical protein
MPNAEGVWLQAEENIRPASWPSGLPTGVAELDDEGLVPRAQIPEPDISDAVEVAIAEASWDVNGIPSQKKTSSFTASLVELGKITECESASLLQVTVPSTSAVAFPDDAGMELVQTGVGQVEVLAGQGVTLRSASSPAGLQARSQWSSVFLRKRAGGAPSLITTGLVMRFRADDISGNDQDPVSTWTAAVGGAATQGTAADRPKLRVASLNGRNVVEFDGTNDLLALDATALNVAKNVSDLTIFIAYKLNGLPSGVRSLFSLSTGNTTGARMSVQQNGTGSVHIATGRRLDADSFAQAAAVVGSSSGESAILTAAYRWSTSDLLLYKNGTQIASNTSFQTNGSTSNTASLTGFIGANAPGSSEQFGGQIAEILVYADGDTGGTLKANVHTYLANTYGLSTPSDYLGLSDEWVVSGDTKV